MGNNGSGTVVVDNLPSQVVNEKFPTQGGDAPVWTSPILANGPHTLTLSVNGGYVTLDDLLVFGPSATPSSSAPTVVDDSNAGITYSGSGWTHCTSGCNSAFGTTFLNGTISYDHTTGDSATYSWTGRQIQFYSETGFNGFANVSIDGGPAVPIDQYSPTAVGNVLIYQSPALASGSHTVTITVSGNQEPGHTYPPYVSIDGFKVYG